MTTAVGAGMRDLDIFEISLVDHPFHGPWSYDDGVCRGCGVGLIVSPLLPALPYAGTSGFSGSDTSRERALAQDSDGTTGDRQDKVLRALGNRAAEGATWKEIADAFGWHHGQASGALSTLHKDGQVARLASERRSRCAVYVLPRFVNGRETAAQGRETPPDPLTVLVAEWLAPGPGGWSRAARDPVAGWKAIKALTGL